MRPGHAASRGVFLLLGLMAAACTSGPPDASGPDQAGGVSRLLAYDAVLVRGWIGDDAVALEPVMPLPAASRDTDNTAGPYGLRGLDDSGRVVFDLRFGAESLAAVAGRPGRHFAFVVPVGAGGPESLATVMLDAGQGRTVTRSARGSRDALLDGLMGTQGVQTVSLADAAIAVTWDADRFELLQVRDPATGSVLALDRDGKVTVTAPGAELEIALSDGTRSAAALFRTAETP